MILPLVAVLVTSVVMGVSVSVLRSGMLTVSISYTRVYSRGILRLCVSRPVCRYVDVWLYTSVDVRTCSSPWIYTGGVSTCVCLSAFLVQKCSRIYEIDTVPGVAKLLRYSVMHPCSLGKDAYFSHDGGIGEKASYATWLLAPPLPDSYGLTIIDTYTVLFYLHDLNARVLRGCGVEAREGY